MSAAPATPSDVARWRRNLQREVDGAHILRQLGFGLAAAAVTYSIGWLLGTTVL